MKEKRKTKPEKYKYWASIIDGTKDALQIAKELNVPFGTVYHASKVYNLPLPRACDLITDYAGVPLEQYKEELKTYTLGDVAKMHGVNTCNLKNWLITRGVTEFPVNKIRKMKPQKITNPAKRTGEAHEMIKYLTTRFTDASIARVFGYSKERVRQIRHSMED